MKVEEYLEKVPELRIKIQNKIIEKRLIDESGTDASELQNEIEELIQARSDVIKLIEKLKDIKDYDIFHLYYIQGYNWKEIALKKDITYQAICKRRNKAYKELQELFDELHQN